MIALRNIEDFIYLFTLIIAYLIAETLSGWFQAFVAKKMGDDTPEGQGLLTLNPIMHIDPIGMIFLILTGFGWGRSAMINPYNIENPHRNLKLFLTYFSNAFAHFVIALGALITLLLSFGITMVDLAKPIVFYRSHSLPLLTAYYPDTSSLMLSFALILVATIYLSVILGVIKLLDNGFHLIMFLFFNDSRGLWYVDLLIPIMLILFFANPLQKHAINGITSVAYFLAHICGAL